MKRGWPYKAVNESARIIFPYVQVQMQKNLKSKLELKGGRQGKGNFDDLPLNIILQDKRRTSVKSKLIFPNPNPGRPYYDHAKTNAVLDPHAILMPFML